MLNLHIPYSRRARQYLNSFVGIGLYLHIPYSRSESVNIWILNLNFTVSKYQMNCAILCLLCNNSHVYFVPFSIVVARLTIVASQIKSNPNHQNKDSSTAVELFWICEQQSQPGTRAYSTTVNYVGKQPFDFIQYSRRTKESWSIFEFSISLSTSTRFLVLHFSIQLNYLLINWSVYKFTSGEVHYSINPSTNLPEGNFIT